MKGVKSDPTPVSMVLQVPLSHERLKVKDEGSTHLGYTGLRGGLEHLKIETRLMDERFAIVRGECCPFVSYESICPFSCVY
jgi:hypothetical protein